MKSVTGSFGALPLRMTLTIRHSERSEESSYFTEAVSNFVIALTYSAGFGSGEPSASKA